MLTAQYAIARPSVTRVD